LGYNLAKANAKAYRASSGESKTWHRLTLQGNKTLTAPLSAQGHKLAEKKFKNDGTGKYSKMTEINSGKSIIKMHCSVLEMFVTNRFF